MDLIEKYIGEIRATDVSSGVHPPEGFPEADVPQKLLVGISSALWGGGKDILKIWKDAGHWTVKVVSKNFDLRHGDFKKLVSLGLSGISYDAPKSINLYFKQ